MGRAVNSPSVIRVLFTTVLMLTASANSTAQNSAGFAALRSTSTSRAPRRRPARQITGQLLRVEENRLVVYESGSPKPIASETVKKVIRHKSRHIGAWIRRHDSGGS